MEVRVTPAWDSNDMAERGFYVLVYDISADKRRAKIARLMESFGGRVQGSVFEAWLTQAELEEILKRSKKVMNQEEDGLRIYFICQACQAKAKMVGPGSVTPPPGVVII